MRVRPHDPLPAHEDCETLPASDVPTAPRSGSLCSLAGLLIWLASGMAAVVIAQAIHLGPF
jgi:hypothetical protein